MITVVSGLPRSGTSMMMQMLRAGGIPVMTDHARKADDDNPRGYYELEKVKKIREDSSWLDEAEGKTFKMVSMLLYQLPPDRRYKIIFMRRDIAEILRSQSVMLQNLGKQHNAADDEAMGRFFSNHLAELESWLKERENMDVLYCRYSDVVDDPGAAAGQIAEFLGERLNVEQMIEAVDPSLHRQRSS
jgi:hypothetical protein